MKAYQIAKNRRRVKNDTTYKMDPIVWGLFHTHTCPMCQQSTDCSIAHSTEEVSDLCTACYELAYCTRRIAALGIERGIALCESTTHTHE